MNNTSQVSTCGEIFCCQKLENFSLKSLCILSHVANSSTQLNFLKQPQLLKIKVNLSEEK